MEEAAKDAELGLLVRHALATGGGLGLAAIAGEALVGGHPAGASAARLLSSGRNVLGLRRRAHGGQLGSGQVSRIGMRWRAQGQDLYC